MERLTNKKLKTICDGYFVNFASKEEAVKYRLLAESAPKYEEIYRKLADYEDKQEQGLLIELPCKVGDTVYVYNYCDYVCTSRDWETGIEECPFENECEFEECKEGNERLFKTAIDSIWNNGQGWEFSVRGLHLEISINAIGKTVFLTRSEAEEALARMKGE